MKSRASHVFPRMVRHDVLQKMMNTIRIVLAAFLVTTAFSGCGTQPEPTVATESFPWSGILNVKEGMTIAEAQELTGQTYPDNGKFHNDTVNLETFCTVEITNRVFKSVVSGHNGVCVEYNP